MLEFQEVQRIPGKGHVDEIVRLVKAEVPFIVEERGNEDFERFAEASTLERIGALFGDREWVVQSREREAFDPFVPPHELTERMPFSAFLAKLENPDPGIQHYLNIWMNEGMEFAAPYFRELEALSPKLGLTRYGGQQLRVLWLGTAGNVTPLHYDTYARSHGTLHGLKQYIFFPPDRLHLRKLQAYPVRSSIGWYSRLGIGPLDLEHCPQLAGTSPHLARCGPGDFVYLPPCWWHHVSIPDGPTVTISATFYPKSSYLRGYHWRMRMTRWLGRHPRVLALVGNRDHRRRLRA